MTTQEEWIPRPQWLSSAAGGKDEDDKIPDDFCHVFFPVLHTFHCEPLLVAVVSTSGAVSSEGYILRE